MIKINNLKLNRIITYLFTLFFIPHIFVSAATVEYTPLVQDAFSGLGNQSGTGFGLGVFLGQVFNFGIAAAVALAVIIIIWGGIEYMTTDSWSGKDEGKKKIQDAFYGLGLALASYLILYTINPCLVIFTANSDCKTNNAFLYPGSAANTTQTTTQIAATDTSTVSASSIYPNIGLLPSINIHSTGNCYNANSSTCTSLDGLPQSAVNGLNSIALRCQGCVTITGGTEVGHASHGENIPTVDISYNSDAVAALSGTTLNESNNYQGTNNYTCEVNGTNQQVPCANPGRSDIHIHIQF